MTNDVGVYRTQVPEGYEWVLPIDDADFAVIRGVGERRAGEAWMPIHMSLLKVDDHGKPQMRSDMPWLGEHVIVLRDEAIEIVGEILRPHGELLPLLCDEARLALFSAPVVEGVLDEAESDIVRFSTGRIMSIRSPAIRSEALGAISAFKLAEMPRGDLYLSENLVKEILATGMTAGTQFKLVAEQQARS